MNDLKEADIVGAIADQLMEFVDSYTDGGLAGNFEVNIQENNINLTIGKQRFLINVSQVDA